MPYTKEELQDVDFYREFVDKLRHTYLDRMSNSAANFYNKNTDENFEKFMKISELDQYKLDNPHISQRPALVAFVGDHISATAPKIDGGMNERLEQIAHSNPGSPLADRYGGSTKTVKEIKTREVLKKHCVLDRLKK